MQSFNITDPQTANVCYAENIENTDPKNSNPVVANTKTTIDYATKLSVQNPIGNAHNAVSHIVTENTTTSANDKNFLLRFFGSIGTFLKKLFSSFRAEKNASSAIEKPQEADVSRNKKKLSFGELKQNLEKRLSELQALPEPDYGQINNLEKRLFYLKKLDTMGSFLQLRFQTVSVSKYAKKGQIEDAKKNLKKLEALGVKNLEIPGGFETALGKDDVANTDGNALKVPPRDRRLLGALSSSTIDLDFKTFEKLYRQLQDDNCLSDKKFTDLMETTSKSTETARRNMATVTNVFAMDGSKLGKTLQQQLFKM